MTIRTHRLLYWWEWLLVAGCAAALALTAYLLTIATRLHIIP